MLAERRKDQPARSVKLILRIVSILVVCAPGATTRLIRGR